MILIVFKYLTPKGFRGITFFPFVFLMDKKDKLNPVFVNHEKIHIRQQLEMLVVPFFFGTALNFYFVWRNIKIGERLIITYHLSGKPTKTKKTPAI